MSGTPWVVQRGKRKQSTTTPASRKRVRISDDVGSLDEKSSSRSKPRDQRTLTQIQWINSPDTSFENDPDLQEIGSARRDGSKAPKTRRSMLKKRNSTLTQMEWLGGPQEVDHDGNKMMDDTAMLPIPDTRNLDQIPQIDGAYDSPRKKNPRKQVVMKEQPRSSSPSIPDRETQDYQPTQALGGFNPVTMGSKSGRRKSARIASKVFSDPDENLNYMSKALSGRGETTKETLPKQPRLEVMDSMEMGEEITPIVTSLQPSTPRRRREIPSSQTPETVTKYRKLNSQRIEASPSRRSARTPLGEKSVNLPSKTYSQGLESARSMLKGNKSSPKRSKICVLKVPSRGLLRRSGRVDDSQQDIFSLQPTSSSSEIGRHSDHESNKTPTVLQKTRDESQLEIPPTSQRSDSSDHEMPSSPPGVETQDSLPDLSDLIPSRKLEKAATMHGSRTQVSQHHQANGQDSILVKDFGRPDSQKEINPPPQESENLEKGANNTKPKSLGIGLSTEGARTPSLNTLVPKHKDQDFDDDFGSPIANDTQFNAGLLQRTSSPDLTVEGDYDGTPTQIIPRMGPPPLPKIHHQPESDQEALLPIPRLIGHSASLFKGPQCEGNKLSDEAEPHHSSDSYDSYATVATVPLNDNVGPLISSSPPLPPVRTRIQRGIYPASMPRPSQISTQDPTQNYLSSLPQPTQHSTQIEPITIKDSSSTYLSQIPKYESQSQGLNLQLVPRLDDEIDDLDLDPSSTAYGVQSARKSTGLLRKETASSLRSIHPSESSRERRKAVLTSSSPTRQASKLQKMANEATPRNARPRADQPRKAPAATAQAQSVTHSSDETSSPISSPDPPPLKRKYDPLPGFDNETQSNFTQNGHITAAYIHRQRESGKWPDWFIPEPFQLPNFKRAKKRASIDE